MKLPFTPGQFFSVFEAYNNAVWPLQVIWVLLAVLVVVMVAWSYRFQQVVIGIILGVLWIWMGLVYHLLFFSAINPAARVFGGLFILQGLLFFWQIAIDHKINFKMTRTWPAYI